MNGPAMGPPKPVALLGLTMHCSGRSPTTFHLRTFQLETPGSSAHKSRPDNQGPNFPWSCCSPPPPPPCLSACCVPLCSLVQDHAYNIHTCRQAETARMLGFGSRFWPGGPPDASLHPLGWQPKPLLEPQLHPTRVTTGVPETQERLRQLRWGLASSLAVSLARKGGGHWRQG